MTNPRLISIPFAESGTKNEIPVSGASEPQQATMVAGFPNVTQKPVSEGGIPPERADFNGILNLYGQHIVNLNKGLAYEFDQEFADSIGGYPLHARIMLSDGQIAQNTLDGNTNNPNSITTGWIIGVSASIIRDSSGLTQQQVNNEFISPYRFGAVGDGVTNDTAAFKLIENSLPKKQVINLAGGTFSIVSIWQDATNGVVLSKDYINGTLLVDGRKLVFDRTSSFALSSASSNRLGQASTTKSLGIKRVTVNNYEIWRPLGGQYWQLCKLNRTAENIPLNWQETTIKQVFGYICAEDGNTYSGSWATLTSETGLSSASTTAYISGRARQAITVGDYVDISYSGGGDLYVVYVGRTSGNYVNVLIDGSQDFICLPNDSSGNKYFDSYTSTDLQFKQLVKIASGLPSGTHTIRLTVSASKNAASTGNRFVFNALSFDNADFGPWRSQADARLWATGQAVLMNQVRKYGANYYYAVADGTTGTIPPTHTSGTVSDGSVSWTYRAGSGYDLVDSTIQTAGSQLEYAYEMIPEGATIKEDVGGGLHGNETQTALGIFVGNNSSVMLDNNWLTGDVISLRESIYSTHSQIGAGLTPVIETRMIRTFKRQWNEIYHSHKTKMKVSVGYFYPHMWPLLHYHGPASKYAVRKFWSPSDGDRACSDFYGKVNPFVGRTKDTLMIAYGDCLQPNGVAGVPTTEKPPLNFCAWLSIDPSSVASYNSADALFAAKAMNTNGADVSAGGYSSMTSKMYFERYSTKSPQTLQSGEFFECFARYGLDLTPN